MSPRCSRRPERAVTQLALRRGGRLRPAARSPRAQTAAPRGHVCGHGARAPRRKARARTAPRGEGVRPAGRAGSAALSRYTAGVAGPRADSDRDSPRAGAAGAALREGRAAGRGGQTAGAQGAHKRGPPQSTHTGKSLLRVPRFIRIDRRLRALTKGVDSEAPPGPQSLCPERRRRRGSESEPERWLPSPPEPLEQRGGLQAAARAAAGVPQRGGGHRQTRTGTRTTAPRARRSMLPRASRPAARRETSAPARRVSARATRYHLSTPTVCPRLGSIRVAAAGTAATRPGPRATARVLLPSLSPAPGDCIRWFTGIRDRRRPTVTR